MQIILKKKIKSTIKELLIHKSNDFSLLERLYFKVVKSDLLSSSDLNIKIKIYKKVSIIIPIFNSINTLLVTLESLNSQDISKKEYENIEVVLVDDGSTDNTEFVIKDKFYKFKLIYVKQKNKGSGAARNLGVKNSMGEILIFIDSDVILQSNFIREHVVRNQVLSNVCFIGFREHIKKENLTSPIFKKIMPNIFEDVRFKRFFSKDWKRKHRECSLDSNREIKIIEETNFLKNFGEYRVLGAWDLSYMVQTFSVSLRHSTFVKVGGFNLKFKGWGMEDTFFGACLIANGNFIIPILSTGAFHIEHSVRSGTIERKQLEFDKNVIIYNSLLNKPLN